MPNIKVFISSVQREFADERQLLCRYIREDALLGRFFLPFIFEELPAIDLTAQQAYLTEAAQCDIYLGLFGEQYGYEDDSGISPTEREYDTASSNHRHRLIFIKQSGSRHAKEKALSAKAEHDVVRKSFSIMKSCEARFTLRWSGILRRKNISVCCLSTRPSTVKP